MRFIKYFLIFIVVFSVFLAFFWQIGKNKNSGPDSSLISRILNRSGKIPVKPTFIWGVNINFTPTDIANEVIANQLLAYVSQLGLNVIRVGGPLYDANYRHQLAPELAIARQKGIGIELSLEHNDKILSGPDPEKAGYDYGKTIASEFKGIVKYYQIGNELAAYAVKPSWGGSARDNYDDTKLEQAMAWFKGVSQGIHEVDPSAKRVVTGHHLMYGFWQEAIKRGIRFEIVGWDTAGESLPIDDITHYQVDGKPYDLIGKLTALGKELWIQESGVNGAKAGYQAAANYMESYSKEIYQTAQFSGFFGFTFSDEIHQAKDPDWQKGLIALEPSSSSPTGYIIGQPRVTFYALQKTIQAAAANIIARPPDAIPAS